MESGKTIDRKQQLTALSLFVLVCALVMACSIFRIFDSNVFANLNTEHMVTRVIFRDIFNILKCQKNMYRNFPRHWHSAC